MREQLKQALSQRLPALKDHMITRYVDKYVSAVMQEIAHQYRHITSADLAQGEMSFAADAVSNSCGRAKIDGRTHYIYALMQESPATSLVIVAHCGSNLTQKVSRVCLNHKFKKDIMEELKSMHTELNPAHLQELREKANVQISVDVLSLESYIKATKAALARPQHSAAYEEKLLRNYLVANQVLSMVERDDKSAFVWEYWEEIDSGRIHGHGLSLQRLPKEVRHAALGRCYRYDFKAASYALMTSFAVQIDPELKVAALRDYIQHRSAIRRRVAEDVGISEEWMKSIFTSLGFGAQLNDSPFTSIRGRLGAEKCQRLMSNSEFAAITKQLAQVSKTILKALGSEDFEFLGRTYNSINPRDQRKRNKRQLLAWVYQCMERAALDTLVEAMPDSYQVKLLVHDCIYLDRPLAAHDLADIKWRLQEIFPGLNFEGDAVVPIHADDWIDHVAAKHERLISQHALHMREEELAAAAYAGPISTTYSFGA